MGHQGTFSCVLGGDHHEGDTGRSDTASWGPESPALRVWLTFTSWAPWPEPRSHGGEKNQCRPNRSSGNCPLRGALETGSPTGGSVQLRSTPACPLTWASLMKMSAVKRQNRCGFQPSCSWLGPGPEAALSSLAGGPMWGRCPGAGQPDGGFLLCRQAGEGRKRERLSLCLLPAGPSCLWSPGRGDCP